MPVVSVIIPTFNREATLKRAVDSVLKQSFQDLECLVIDDASTDHSLKLLSEYKDPRLKVYSLEENKGVSAARNYGFEKAQGSWIALLDSDDEWFPHRLDKQMELAESEPELPLIHGEEIWVRNGKRVNPKFKYKKSGGRIFQSCLPLCVISPSTTLMKRELYEEMQGFREDFPVCEDYELWLRVTSRYEVGFIEEPVITKYGGHEDQLSLKYKAMDFWRVKAMEELYRIQTLDSDDEKALIAMLLEKSQILKLGFEKYQRLEELAYINSLLNEFSEKSSNLGSI